MPGAHDSCRKGHKLPVKIAMITFAYNNANVIKKLIKRGAAIKNENYKKLNEINSSLIE